MPRLRVTSSSSIKYYDYITFNYDSEGRFTMSFTDKRFNPYVAQLVIAKEYIRVDWYQDDTFTSKAYLPVS